MRIQGSDQYTVWNTDSNGNFVSNGTGGVVSGSSAALQSLEPSFQQDLNGDGIIGIPPSVTIEAYGNTSLAVVGNNYALNPVRRRHRTPAEIRFSGYRGSIRRLDVHWSGTDI